MRRNLLRVIVRLFVPSLIAFASIILIFRTGLNANVVNASSNGEKCKTSSSSVLSLQSTTSPQRRDEDYRPKGFVSTLIKYLDYALDFLFKSFFGGNTKPSPNDDDDDGDDDDDDDKLNDDTYGVDVSRREGRRKVSYKGYQLLRIWPRTDDVTEDIKNMAEQPGVQLWVWPIKNASVDVALPPDVVSTVKEQLKDRDIEFSVLSVDIQKIITGQNAIFKEDSSISDGGSKNGKLNWNRYHSLDEIYSYLEYLQDTFPDLVEAVTIGKSSEGRELKLIRISTGKSNNGSLKPAIWIDAGIHAREWISVAVAVFIIRQLVEFNKSYKNLLQDLDWYILPVANPDGYLYTHTTDRLWSKSRSNVEGNEARYFWDEENEDCKGVDLNRNWNYRWNEDSGDSSRGSNSPCRETYAGPSAFSEPETRSMSNFIMEHRDQIVIYLSFHAYSQTWLIPSSSTTSTKGKSRDYDDLLYMGRKAIESLKKSHGTNYQLITKYTNLYPTSGNSDDWAKNKVGVKYSYTIELRDKGTYGFLLPPAQIVPTGKEIFTAIRTLTRSVLNNAVKNL